MMTFMLGVLGSVMFWCISIPVNFIIGLLVLKNIFPDALKPLTKNERIFEPDRTANGDSYAFCLFMILIFMLSWYVIIAGFIVCKLFSFLLPPVKNILVKLINSIPTITINKED